MPEIFNPKQSERLVSRSALTRYKSERSWFSRPEEAFLPTSIHGQGHQARVSVLQERIATWHEIEYPLIKIDRESLRWAAPTHDLRREADDRHDEHEIRAENWVNDNLQQIVRQRFGRNLSNSTFKKVKFIDRWHVPDDGEVANIFPELRIFKDADALDRVRSNDLDDNYLRLDISRGLIEIAKELHDLSIDLQQAGAQTDPFEAVMEAALLLGLIKK